jgi:inosine/xanthosine triphosphatase
MEKLIIAVGSTRRPKVKAVTEAAQTFGPLLAAGATIDVTGVEVESGVSHTPCSREELMRGARKRAEALVRLARKLNEPWGYFVGLEGGLDLVYHAMPDEDATRESAVTPRDVQADIGTIRRVFLESWVYVTDGTRGHFGRSGAVELPEPLAHEVLDRGVELSEAIDRYASAQDPQHFAGASGIRNGQGAWGVLSADLITRQEAFRVAVIAAFAPFYNATMYGAKTNAGEMHEATGQNPGTPPESKATHGKDVSQAAAR